MVNILEVPLVKKPTKKQMMLAEKLAEEANADSQEEVNENVKVGSLETPAVVAKKPRKPRTEAQIEKGRENLAKGREALARKQAERREETAKMKGEMIIKKAKKLEGRVERKTAAIKKEIGITESDEESEADEPQIVIVKKKKPKAKKVIVYESESDEETQPIARARKSAPVPIQIKPQYGLLKFI